MGLWTQLLVTYLQSCLRMIAQACFLLACATVLVQGSYIEAYNGGLDYNLGNIGIGYGADLSNGYGYDSGYLSSGLVGSGLISSGLVESGLVGTGLVSSGLVGTGLVSSGLVESGLIGSGLVSSGLIEGCASVPTLGPRTPALPVIRAGTVVVPEPGKIVDLPAPPAPLPRTISNICSCSKTVIKPQVYERTVRIPSSIRYIKKSYVPVEEKIPYCARGQVGIEASAPTAFSNSYGGAIAVEGPNAFFAPRSGCGIY